MRLLELRHNEPGRGAPPNKRTASSFGAESIMSTTPDIETEKAPQLRVAIAAAPATGVIPGAVVGVAIDVFNDGTAPAPESKLLLALPHRDRLSAAARCASTAANRKSPRTTLQPRAARSPRLPGGIVVEGHVPTRDFAGPEHALSPAAAASRRRAGRRHRRHRDQAQHRRHERTWAVETTRPFYELRRRRGPPKISPPKVPNRIMPPVLAPNAEPDASLPAAAATIVAARAKSLIAQPPTRNDRRRPHRTR